jgi:hypothetical protein
MSEKKMERKVKDFMALGVGFKVLINSFEKLAIRGTCELRRRHLFPNSPVLPDLSGQLTKTRRRKLL